MGRQFDYREAFVRAPYEQMCETFDDPAGFLP